MSGIVNIHGREYKTVALRVHEFREKHPDWSINTEIIQSDEVVIIKASVADDEGRLIGTGYAEEVRGSTRINETSALENCETSAIGRALAACGFAGSEYASANEVQDALVKQALSDEHKRFARHTLAMLNNFESIMTIKNGIGAEKDSDEYKYGAEAWFELEPEAKEALFLAYTKGGCFTTAEWKEIRSKEFRIAYYGHENYLESSETAQEGS